MQKATSISVKGSSIKGYDFQEKFMSVGICLLSKVKAVFPFFQYEPTEKPNYKMVLAVIMILAYQRRRGN